MTDRMKSQRPYLLRAMHEWIVDSGFTPHLLVDAQRPGVQVPAEAVQEGRIVLNVAPEAVRGFLIDDQGIEFDCRFSGVSRAVLVPVDAVMAIYARENGAGMQFEAPQVGGDEGSASPLGDAAESPANGDDDPDPPEGGTPGGSPRGGHLRVVK